MNFCAMADKLKIGVLGAGHLGKIHMKCILELPDTYEFVGFFDPSPENAKLAAEQFGTMAFHNAKSLIEACDVVDIVTPTGNHFESASMAIRSLKHVFIESFSPKSLNPSKHPTKKVQFNQKAIKVNKIL